MLLAISLKADGDSEIKVSFPDVTSVDVLSLSASIPRSITMTKLLGPLIDDALVKVILSVSTENHEF